MSSERSAEVKRLGANSAVYFVTSLMIRGLGFLLLPLYSRALQPADYGIITVSGTVRSLLAMLMSLAIHGAITPLYVKAKSDDERRQLNGAVLAFLCIFPPLVAMLLDMAGKHGLLDVFHDIPFHPYMQLTVWGACLLVFQEIPAAVFMAQEKPFGVTIFGIFSALQGTMWGVLFVVVLHQGAAGSLRAAAAAGAANGLFTLVVIGRQASFRFSISILKYALVVSIPLIPHLFSHWLLVAVDRVILERQVTESELGLYALGTQFADVARMVVSSVLGALSPIILRRLAADPQAADVPRLGTYALLPIIVASLGASLLAPDALRVMTPPAYHAAGALVPWLIAGVAFQGFYGVWSQSIWHAMRTRAIPLLTFAAGLLNVALLFILVPRLGLGGAPISIAASYAFLAGLYAVAAQRIHPIAWEYRRWILMSLVAVAWFFIGRNGSLLPVGFSIAIKITVTLVAYPLTLLALRFATPAELEQVRRLASGLNRLKPGMSN